MPPGINLSDPELIVRGSTLFAQNCSVGYCHGIAGKAGRGPRLRGREWDKNYLFKVTFEGIPNSSMPAWKDRLTEADISAVVAYILTLSKLTSDAAELPAALAATQPAPSGVSPVKPASSGDVGGVFGDAEKGKSLFFDSSNDQHCAACHRIGGTGGSVGPELSGVRFKAVKDLFIEIVLPSVRLPSERPLLSITTKSGEQIRGVKAEESSSHIKLYDVGSLPPVLRNLPKDQIQKLEIENRSAMPANYGEVYTVKQLLDIIAFLKAGSGNQERVSLNDLR